MKENTLVLKMKKYALNLIPFIIGIGCIISYGIIGAELAPDGRVIEPFYLIPLTYLFFAIGIIGIIVRVVLSKIISNIRSKKVSE